MYTRIAALAGALLLASAVTAAAQTNDVRLFVNASVGAQSGSQTSTTTLTSTLYGEPATVVSARTLDKKAFFDLTVGRAISGRLGGAFSFSTRSSESDAAVAAAIPDPIFFGRPRAVSSTIDDLGHSERWFGFLATYGAPVTDKLTWMVMAGPAVVSVKHDVPVGMTVTEAAGGPQVSVRVEPQSKSFVGVQLGLDFRYQLTRQLGAGLLLGFNRASGTVIEGNELDLGGGRIGIGIRLNF
jgi:opacity protein-like surface antigen